MEHVVVVSESGPNEAHYADTRELALDRAVTIVMEASWQLPGLSDSKVRDDLMAYNEYEGHGFTVTILPLERD